MTKQEYLEKAFEEIKGLENFTGNSLPSIAHHLAIKYFKYGCKNFEMQNITRIILVNSEQGINLENIFYKED